MSACTGGDESLFGLLPPSAIYSLPSLSEELSPSSRGTTSGRASSSKYWVYSRSITSYKGPSYLSLP